MTWLRPLLAVFQALGVDVEDLVSAETPTTLNHVFQISGAAAGRLSDDEFLAIPETYGESVRVEFSTDGMPEMTITSALVPAEISSFRESVNGVLELEMAVHVDKRGVLRHLFDRADENNTMLFLFSASLERELRSGLVALSTWLAGPDRNQAIIIVLNEDVELHGPYLHVVGGSHLERGIEGSKLASLMPAALKRVASLRDQLVGWDERFAPALTPWHFVAQGADSKGIQSALDARLCDLTLLYICDRARRFSENDDPRVAAEFRGRDHRAVVIFDDHDEIEISESQRKMLLASVDWVYELEATAQQRPDWAPDRLPFLQTRVSQLLESGSGDPRELFVQELPGIMDGVRWMWKAFIEERVSTYLDEVKGLEEVVSETTEKLSVSISDLTKSLTDTILAAIAVLIGSFIAAAYRSPFNERLFRVGILTYGGYVLLFPGVVGLVSAWKKQSRSEASLTQRRKSFESALGTDRVTEIVDARLVSVKNSFRSTFIVVAVLYGLLALAAVVAAIIVPGYLTHGTATTRALVTLPLRPLLS